MSTTRVNNELKICIMVQMTHQYNNHHDYLNNSKDSKAVRSYPNVFICVQYTMHIHNQYISWRIMDTSPAINGLHARTTQHIHCIYVRDR